jgi:hypothetical protein
MIVVHLYDTCKNFLFLAYIYYSPPDKLEIEKQQPASSNKLSLAVIWVRASEQNGRKECLPRKHHRARQHCHYQVSCHFHLEPV